jgi:GNAT superfamily N-acetyltransferase
VAPVVWPAGWDEAETVADLLVAFRDYYGRDWPSANAFHATVERLMETNGAEFLLGAPDADAPPAGVCQLRFRLSVWTAAQDCWLEDLFVRDDARGAGVGRALVEAAIARAEARGCRRIELDADDANAPAIGLYEALGFGFKQADGKPVFLQRTLTPPA